MDLYDIAVARKLSSGGGGGRSDFSTAEVTISGGTLQGVLLPFITEGGYGLPNCIFNIAQSYPQGTYKIALYKEGTMILIDTPVTISGNITEEDGMYLITGDCTITITEVAQG